MSRRRRGDGADPPPPGSFADAMRDVDPLPGRDRVKPPPSPAPPRRPAADRERPAAPTPAPPHALRIEWRGEHAEGRADDVSRALLARLRSGSVAVDRELDLHGMRARAARRALEAAVQDAQARGQRCLLVIHGRGSRSGAAPVLKASLPDWLASPGCAAHVLAFCVAPARLGGPGASLVWLRRAGP